MTTTLSPTLAPTVTLPGVDLATVNDQLTLTNTILMILLVGAILIWVLKEYFD